MKYDQKWRGGGAAAKVLQLSTKFRKMFTSFQCPFTINNLKVSVKIESDTESEPVITENSPGSPIKIAEELDKKTFLQHHRRRRKSSGSTSATKAAAAGSPSPRSKSASGARSRLKLSVGSGRASVSPTGTAHAHTPILTATLSEVSPRSPLFDIANVRDISEVLEEDTISEDQPPAAEAAEDESPSSAPASRRLSELILSSVHIQKQQLGNSAAGDGESAALPKPKPKNPFHFNSSKLKSSDKSDSEPKKPVTKARGSNKKRSEILETVSNSVQAEPPPNIAQSDTSDSETLREEVPGSAVPGPGAGARRPRKKWQLGPAVPRPEVLARPPPVCHTQLSSVESGGCYYCRQVRPNI